jgi:hypothetical protein
MTVIPHVWVAPTLIVANLMGMAMALTNTSAVPLLPPEVAVIVADPFVRGVTTPDGLTVATVTLDDDQTNGWPGIVSPLALWALAVN